MHSFRELGVPERTSQILHRQGITTPNPVQRHAIPALLDRMDAVIEAPTGSGKTLAFLLPLIERLGSHGQRGPRALIVGPTRELATQIASVLRHVQPELKVALLFGGVPYAGQIKALRQIPDVVVGCPGRIVDLARQGIARFDLIEYLVLDEADEMLDQGFAPDVERIIGLTPKSRQTVLASATIPDWVQTMITKHLNNPLHARITTDVEPALEHGLLSVRREHKVHTLHRLLSAERGQTIVFHRTKHGAKKLARDLAKMGHSAGELQGNLSQNARDRVINSFRRGDTAVLVATNVAARGIDVADVGLVVNYELPETAQWLTHRVGRTARNGAEGRALTLLTEDDGAQWHKLRKLGAPDLRHVDGDRLLDHGEWTYLPPRPTAHTAPRRQDPPAHASSRSYRVRPRDVDGSSGRRGDSRLAPRRSSA